MTEKFFIWTTSKQAQFWNTYSSFTQLYTIYFSVFVLINDTPFLKQKQLEHIFTVSDNDQITRYANWRIIPVADFSLDYTILDETME